MTTALPALPLTAPSVARRIPLSDGSGQCRDCVVSEAGVRELRNWQKLIHDPYIASDPQRLDRDWRWPLLLFSSYVVNDAYGRLTESFQLLVASPTGRAVPVGQAMLVSGYPHPGRPEDASAFVWYLTSTPPAALQALGVTERFVVMPLLLDTAVQASRWHGLQGRVSLHADHRGTAQQQDDLVARYLRCGLSRRNHLKHRWLSLLRRMDDRYFVYEEASAHACTLRWQHLR